MNDTNEVQGVYEEFLERQRQEQQVSWWDRVKMTLFHFVADLVGK